METTRLMSSREVQKYLGVSRGTLDMMRCRGSGPPYIRVGRLIKYDKAKLIDWIEENTMKGEINGRFIVRESRR